VRTSPDYALYLLATDPPKPGLVRVKQEGCAIEAELWELPAVGMASFLAQLPSPMALGRVQLDDGTSVIGFLVEPLALDAARDISHYQGWRNFLLGAAATAAG
jgi:allophanate hydrolase